MAITDNLSSQHKEILKLITKINELLNHDSLSKDSARVRELLSILKSGLTHHLVMEDEALYPALCRHPDNKVRTLSQQYLEEMGGIRDSFEKYLTRWHDNKTIQNNPQAFAEETQSLFQMLEARIDKEDNNLYPLLSVL